MYFLCKQNVRIYIEIVIHIKIQQECEFIYNIMVEKFTRKRKNCRERSLTSYITCDENGVIDLYKFGKVLEMTISTFLEVPIFHPFVAYQQIVF